MLRMTKLTTGALHRQGLSLSWLRYQQPEKCCKENLQKPASSLQLSSANHWSPYWLVRLLSHGMNLSANGGQGRVYIHICLQLSVSKEEGGGWSTLRVSPLSHCPHSRKTAEWCSPHPPPLTLSFCTRPDSFQAHRQYPAGNPTHPPNNRVPPNLNSGHALESSFGKTTLWWFYWLQCLHMSTQIQV